jgi:hypothetical protein
MLLLPLFLQLPLLLLLLPSRFDSVAAADCSRSLPLLMVHGLMCANSWGFFFLGHFFTALPGGLTRFLPSVSLRCFFRPRVEAAPGGVFLCSTGFLSAPAGVMRGNEWMLCWCGWVLCVFRRKRFTPPLASFVGAVPPACSMAFWSSSQHSFPQTIASCLRSECVTAALVLLCLHN